MICPTCLADVPPLEALTCTSCGAGLLLAGRYRLEHVLSSSPRGGRFRGWDTRDDRAVVLKEHPLGAHVEPKRAELAEREARVQAQLHHPRIPAGLDSFVAGAGRARALWTVQALVEGQDIAAEGAARRYTVPEVLELVAELLDILGWLHRLSPPVFHRDVKPANLIRGRDGHIHLVDFGAVRDALEAGGGSTVAGTFGFMAPEQFGGEAGPWTDVFGAGVTAIALLSRREPRELHDRSGRFAWEGAVIAPAPVHALLSRMVEPDPVRRASDAPALARECRALAAAMNAAAEPGERPRVPAGRPGPVEPAGPQVRWAVPPGRAPDWANPEVPELPAVSARGAVNPAPPPRSVMAVVLLAVVGLSCAGTVGVAVSLLPAASSTPSTPTPSQPIPAPAPAPIPAPVPGPDLATPTPCWFNAEGAVEPPTTTLPQGEVPEALRRSNPRFPHEAEDLGSGNNWTCTARTVLDDQGVPVGAWVGDAGCPVSMRQSVCAALPAWRYVAGPAGTTFDMPVRFTQVSHP